MQFAEEGGPLPHISGRGPYERDFSGYRLSLLPEMTATNRALMVLGVPLAVKLKVTPTDFALRDDAVWLVSVGRVL